MKRQEEIKEETGECSLEVSQDKSESKNSRIHRVEGYNDTENMWEKIWNLEKADLPPNKYQNLKSEYI